MTERGFEPVGVVRPEDDVTVWLPAVVREVARMTGLPLNEEEFWDGAAEARPSGPRVPQGPRRA